MQKLSVILLWAVATSVIADECNKPYKVEIPDGASSSKEVMIDTQKSIKTYMSEANAYLACLEAVNRNLATAILSEEAIAEERAMTNRRHNAMVDEMNAVADQFNAQVRAYKARHSDG